MIKKHYRFGCVMVSILWLASCSPVAPYQKAFLNQSEMELTSRAIESFETNVEAYREGASGANGGKVGGGCGCN